MQLLLFIASTLVYGFLWFLFGYKIANGVLFSFIFFIIFVFAWPTIVKSFLGVLKDFIKETIREYEEEKTKE